MVTVLQAHGLAVHVYKDDHPPAHVHVMGDGFAKIDLVTLEIIRQRGMTLGELRRARRLVRDNRDALLAEGRLIHG